MSKKPLTDTQKHRDQWEKGQIYKYKESSAQERFVIDTPPPTSSGDLHIGHVFSYTQTDILARFFRMKGKNVFYPMGWDNNGLPTERRVQNLYKITCNPSLSKENVLQKNTQSNSSFQQVIPLSELIHRKNKKPSRFLQVSRKSFIHICKHQTKEDQKKYEHLWRTLALSVDWQQTYETISDQTQLISQQSFLDLYKKGFVENRFSPVFWDTQFQTAVAQADIVEHEQQGAYHNIKFSVEGGGGDFEIATTRPELLPACVAVVAHPEDTRYQKFFGKTAITPLFCASVPIVPSCHADPEKGTGILMVCTFGDREDVDFWTQFNQKSNSQSPHQSLPLKQVIGEDGRMKTICFQKKDKLNQGVSDKKDIFISNDPDQAHQYYSELQTLPVLKARIKIGQILNEKKYLVSKTPKVQMVKFYEKGQFPLELIPARQWYIQILKHKEILLEQGRKVQWHPPSMLKRYEQWVESLNQDWCISRQRFFGVPFPVWYPLDKNKIPDYNKPLFPELNSEPVDPLSSAPADYSTTDLEAKNYTEDKRGQPFGFQADRAVMDTWATSSLTPQINSRWNIDHKRHKLLFPAHLRPQAHEIIRTWAFYTIAKSYFHEKTIPWKHIVISGWVVTPDRLKISKSKGNNQMAPAELIETYSADSLRYWAGKARLAQNTVYDEGTVKNGQRLRIKLANAFRFMLMHTENKPFLGIQHAKITSPIDQVWLGYLIEKHEQITLYLEQFHYAQGLEVIEKTFWLFCDNYLELVKGRAYQLKEQKEGCSVIHSLDLSLYVFIKLLAPFMPYITEELWSQRYTKEQAFVHQASWNKGLTSKEIQFNFSFNSNGLLNFSFKLLEQIRAQKSAQNTSLSAPLSELKIRGNREQKVYFDLCKQDIARAANTDIKHIHYLESTAVKQSKVQNNQTKQISSELPEVCIVLAKNKRV